MRRQQGRGVEVDEFNSVRGRGLGGKRINRVNVSLTNHDFFNLKQLSIACDLRHTSIAELLILRAMENSQIVHELQNEFNIQEKYRVYREYGLDDYKKFVYR